MPDAVEIGVEQILQGLPIEGEDAEICDFTIADFNAALDTQGIKPSVSSNFQPVLGKSVTFIVAAVLLNESDEVLLIQEAKESCSGKWYLPAGRMEKGENILEAGKREIFEETGLIVELTTLLVVECASGSWIRFVMTGHVLGGTLKTPAHADKESLQAKWIKNVSDVPLRSSDFLHLIERARAYKHARTVQDNTWHPDQLPTIYPHRRLLMRLVVVIKKRTTNHLHILVHERNKWHLPTCEIHPTKSVHFTLRRFMIDLFGAEVPPHRPHGILSVEHDGTNGTDGICLTVLVAFKPPLEDVPIIAKCVWHEVNTDLAQKLIRKTTDRNSVFTLHVIR